MTEQARRAERRRPAVETAEDFLRVGVIGEFEAQAVYEDERGKHGNPGWRVA